MAALWRALLNGIVVYAGKLKNISQGVTDLEALNASESYVMARLKTFPRGNVDFGEKLKFDHYATRYRIDFSNEGSGRPRALPESEHVNVNLSERYLKVESTPGKPTLLFKPV